jgi:hypothetical protein
MKSISKNYMTIQGWMVEDLDLSGNTLLAYALIYGFAQDNESEFTGSLSYVCTWLNCSRPTATKALDELCERNLITKRVEVLNGVTFNRYRISLQGVKNLDGGSKESLQGGSKVSLGGGSKETLHYNNSINKDNLNTNNNTGESEKNERSEIETQIKESKIDLGEGVSLKQIKQEMSEDLQWKELFMMQKKVNSLQLTTILEDHLVYIQASKCNGVSNYNWRQHLWNRFDKIQEIKKTQPQPVNQPTGKKHKSMAEHMEIAKRLHEEKKVKEAAKLNGNSLNGAQSGEVSNETIINA